MNAWVRRLAAPGERPWCGAWAILLLVWHFAASVPALAQPVFPELTGRIVDEANLLSEADRASLEMQLSELEAKSSDQLVVVTLTTLQGYDIADFGYQLGRKWAIGQAGKNNGALLVVAPNERKVRIEVGRGLEPVLTDLMTKIIIENAILPEFRRADFAAGIKAGVRDIIATLLGDAEGVRERARGIDASEPDWVNLLIVAFWLAVLTYVIWAHYQHFQQARTLPSQPGASRRRGARYRDPSVIGAGGGSGNWRGGGWSSGTGRGWSGGGGDFGGGGSSGSW